MKTLKSVETQLSSLFKGLPPLPASTKEALANIWPWLALFGGLINLMMAWGLWEIMRRLERVSEALGSLSSLYYSGVNYTLTSSERMFIYIGVLMLVINAVLLLMAFPLLKKRASKGWDLVFIASLINVAYGVVQIFTYSRGVGSFIGSLIGSAIGFYLLFQVREKFQAKTK